jgi:hypothetical protein
MSLAQQDIVEIQQVQALYGHAFDWPDGWRIQHRIVTTRDPRKSFL